MGLCNDHGIALLQFESRTLQKYGLCNDHGVPLLQFGNLVRCTYGVVQRPWDSIFAVRISYVVQYGVVPSPSLRCFRAFHVFHLPDICGSPKRPQTPPLVQKRPTCGQQLIRPRWFGHAFFYDANGREQPEAGRRFEIENHSGSTDCKVQYHSLTGVLKMANHAPQMGKSCVTTCFCPPLPVHM